MKYKNIDLIWLGHAGFKINSLEGKTIYIDPFKVPASIVSRADVIFITHSHPDHCSIEDINKLSQDGTVVVCTPDAVSKLSHVDAKVQIVTIEPNSQRELFNNEIQIWTIPAYNLTKIFHDRGEDWVGYIIQVNNVLIYHAGDTDFIPEMKKLVNIDIAMLSVGGNYTMNAGEAGKAVAVIKPKLAIPMHFGSVVGTKSDAEIFAKYCSAEGIDVKIPEIGK